MNIPNYEKCVKYALQMKGIEGDHFVDTDLRVYERSTANPQTLPALLKKDGIVIPEVKVSLFNKVLPGTTATVVISADEATGTVELFNPISRVIRPFLLEEFSKAWVDAGGACTTAFPRDSKTYNPKLIDLKHVTLPDSLSELREAIAENAHDMWATERQSEGWTYGPKRDDARLETPDMVPYAQLEDSERQYDRLMADDTLKLLVALGYKIERGDRNL